jgi:hypothetical protein
MDMYCDWCHLRFGSQEKRVVQNGKTFHPYCCRRDEISYTQEGAPHDAAVQHHVWVSRSI